MNKLLLIIPILFALLGGCNDRVHCYTEQEAVKAMMGEARGEGYHGLLAVACGIRNRGTLKGVYGLNAEFNEPEWVWDMARKAWKESETNRIHTATHWESVNFKVPYWAKNMKVVYKHKDHIFYK